MRCSKCILPDSFFNIKYDEKSVCNYCSSHRSFKPKGEQKLVELLKSAECKGEKYDCLIPISGGKDSGYALYYVNNMTKLRTLAYYFDNGFSSENAKDNIKKMARKLDVDLIVIKSDIQQKVTREYVEAWSKNPLSEPFPRLCFGCEHGIYGGAYKIAEDMKIPLVVLGGSSFEKSDYKKLFYIYNDSEVLHYLIKYVFINPRYLNVRNVLSHLRIYVRFGFNPKRTHKNIQLIQLFDYLDYDEEKVLSTVTNKLGWKCNDNQLSWHSDCMIHYGIDYMLHQVFHFLEEEEMYSAMIRENKMTRSDALHRIAKINDKLSLSQFTKAMDILELTPDERTKLIDCQLYGPNQKCSTKVGIIRFDKWRRNSKPAARAPNS